MVMKLYGTVTSNVERACLPLFLAEVDMEKEVELVKVDLVADQHKAPTYKSKQIFSKVPCLEDDDVTIFESRAIAKYIAEKYETDLLGKTLKEKAMINAWMESEAHNFNPTVGPILRELFMARVYKRDLDQKLIATCIANLETALGVYESHLSKHKYLAGERYTMADAFHTPGMEKVLTLEKVFAGILDRYPHVKDWVLIITSMSAFQKCLQIDWEHATLMKEVSKL